MMGALHDFLHANSNEGIISFAILRDTVIRFGLSHAEVEEATLSLGLLPERYLKNAKTISQVQQLKLFRSHVAVIGCGGLGGYIIEELTRIGVGTLTIIDSDLFEEHNLNRQLHAILDTLGEPKVAAAGRRVAEINPAVTIIPRRNTFGKENGLELLGQACLAMDGLDSIPARLTLAEICEQANIPLVHGSIAGWYGQVTVQYPGDRTLQKLYARYPAEKGVERELGNPSFSPALVASIEVAEAVKMLLGRGTPLRRKLLSVNLLDMEIAVMDIRD